MRLSGINSNIRFGSVYAVTSDKQQAEELKKVISRTPGYGCVLDMTDLYRKEFACDDDETTAQGTCFSVVVTGHEDYNKVTRLAKGWATDAEIAEHITDFIELHNFKVDISKIQKSMKL